MKEKNLSVRQVEKMTNVGRSTISDIKLRKVYPTILTLERLAKGLDITIRQLIESDYL